MKITSKRTGENDTVMVEHKKRKRPQVDKIKAGILVSLEECAYRLDFIIECVSNGSDLSKSSCAREGLSITLKDLQGQISNIRDGLQGVQAA